jgi:NodT family efflux transporter outer membrane factor (OMF) lipoprotein
MTSLMTATILSGCVVGPNYVRPTAPTATHFKEAEGWTPADPQESIDKGAWWSMFHDPVLDGLEQRIAISNQTLKQYEAIYRQAHQIVAEARSQYFPTVSGSLGAQESKGTSTTGIGGSSTSTTGGSIGGTSTTTSTGSVGGSSTSTGGATVVTNSGRAVSTYSAGLDASWVPDLWGKVRRTVEGDRASAQSAAANIANYKLSLQATLAEDYFELRVTDEEIKLYRQTVADYQKYLTLTVNQYNAGTQSKSAVVTAQTQLLSAQASLVNFAASRAQYEHAIAMLVGVTPAELTIAPATLSRDVPVAPTGVASTLLQRRPDVAAAERTVDYANAQIGVAESAFYPTLTLSGSAGYDANTLGSLFNASSSLWSVGASAADTLLDFGLRRAEVRAARAVYDEDVAAYRQTVLTAFQNVEDELAALRVYEQQEQVELEYEKAAKEAVQLDLNEYKAGIVDYTTVISAETSQLAASQNVITVLESRLLASVLLVEYVGGGWTSADLPKS